MHRWLKHITIAITLFSILFSIILWNIYQHRLLIPWDEAAYAEWANWTADGIRLHDIQKIISINLNHFDRPPLPTLFHAFGNVLLNLDTLIVGRLISSFWFVISCIFIFVLSQKFGSKIKSKTTAIVALVFFITSPMMIIFANSGMREMIGVALTLSTIYFYIRAYHSRKTIDWIVLSFVYCILMFTRYNYSIIVLIPLGIEQCIRGVITRSYVRRIAETIIAFVPAWILLAFYIYSSGNTFLSFYTIFTSSWNITGKLGTFWDFVLFYPKSIIYLYSISPLVGIAIGLGFLVGHRHIKTVEFRIGILLVLVNLLFGMKLFINLQERYIISTVPFIFVIASYEWISVLFGLRIPKKIIGFMIAFFCVLAISIPITHPNTICSIGAYTFRSPICNQPDYSDLIFSYDRKKWAKQLPPPGYQSPQDVYRWIAQTIDLSKPLTFIGESNEFSQPYRNILFEEYKKNGISPINSKYSSYIVTLVIESSSRFYTRDYQNINQWKLGQIASLTSDPALTKIAEKNFEDLGVVVQVFAR